jgi:hypothetical protein
VAGVYKTAALLTATNIISDPLLVSDASGLGLERSNMVLECDVDDLVQ